MNKVQFLFGCASFLFAVLWSGCSDRGQDRTRPAKDTVSPEAPAEVKDSLPAAFKNYKVMADPAKRRFFANLDNWTVVPPDDILDAAVAHLMKPTPKIHVVSGKNGAAMELPNRVYEDEEKRRLASRIVFAYSYYRFDEKRFKKDLPVSKQDMFLYGWNLSVQISENATNQIAAHYAGGKVFASPSVANSLFSRRLSHRDNSQALLTQYKGKKGIVLLGSLNSCAWLGFVDINDTMDKSQYFSGGCQLNKENIIPIGSLFSFSQVGSITRDHYLKHFAGKSGLR